MTAADQSADSPGGRMGRYRDRMRASGLRPVQVWVPDTRSAEFAERCRRQAMAVAAGDPAGDELMAFVESLRDDLEG